MADVERLKSEFRRTGAGPAMEGVWVEVEEEDESSTHVKATVVGSCALWLRRSTVALFVERLVGDGGVLPMDEPDSSCSCSE